MQVKFVFHFAVKNYMIYMMDRGTPCNVTMRDGQTCFLMVYHAILRQFSNYRFCAISSRELSECAIFMFFFQLCLQTALFGTAGALVVITV